MIELVIVVLLMGIMAAAAAPRFSGALAERRAKTVARRLVADLRLARRHAMSTSSNQAVEFFTTPSHGYRLPGMAPPGQASADREVVFSELAGSTTHAADFDGETTILFNGFGKPLAGSPPAPLVNGSVAITSGGISHVVIINPTTGRASLP